MSFPLPLSNANSSSAGGGILCPFSPSVFGFYLFETYAIPMQDVTISLSSCVHLTLCLKNKVSLNLSIPSGSYTFSAFSSEKISILGVFHECPN